MLLHRIYHNLSAVPNVVTSEATVLRVAKTVMTHAHTHTQSNNSSLLRRPNNIQIALELEFPTTVSLVFTLLMPLGCIRCFDKHCSCFHHGQIIG
jgi:hypothetical protein